MRGVFINFEEAMEEVGELVGAFQRGMLRREDMAQTLEGEEGAIQSDLLSVVHIARRSAIIKISRRHGKL